MHPDRRAKDSMRRDYDWSRARLSVEFTVVSASSLLPGLWHGKRFASSVSNYIAKGTDQ